MVELLQLDQLDENRFQNRFNQANINSHLYGGQVLGQALHAAVRTVEADRLPKSLHGYFIRAGEIEKPVLYAVEILRDGRTFSSRRVTASQDGRAIFVVDALFHVPEEGVRHEYSAPPADLPAPETLRNLMQLANDWPHLIDPAARRRMTNYQRIEVRPTDPERHLAKIAKTPRNSYWIRAQEAPTDDPRLHACMLAYISDYWLAAAGLIRHRPALNVKGVTTASLSHAMWFHAPARADAWHLYDTASPWGAQGRALCIGALYSREQELVATVAQELLLRLDRAG